MMGGAQEFVNRLVPGAVGQAILVLSAIVALGVGLGCLRFRKLGLGSAGCCSPALAFASSLSESEAPLVAYAAVYPLTMVLRVFFAQVLVLLTLG